MRCCPVYRRGVTVGWTQAPSPGGFTSGDANLDGVDRRARDIVDALAHTVDEHTHLGGPCRVRHLDDQAPGIEADRLDVGGDGLADDLFPLAEHPAHGPGSPIVASLAAL